MALRPLTLRENGLHACPSLGAEYRGLWKTCQEKFMFGPQNIWCVVSNLSIRSGTRAVTTIAQFQRAARAMCCWKQRREIDSSGWFEKNR